jgi:DNA mismatch endonuclease, patch repair protein
LRGGACAKSASEFCVLQSARSFKPARTRCDRTMADRVSPARRSAIMAKVGSRNTGPEMVVRRALHAKGYRYTLHERRLPGSPDLCFPKRHKAIFVHGCFWHGHACRWGRLPKSKLEYWKPKIAANKARDRKTLRELAKSGWRSLVVWQCELRKAQTAITRAVDFLEDRV